MNKTKTLTICALFMALITVTTAYVQIPLPLTGYIHLGDTFMFLAWFFLKKPYAITVAALGSALADVIAFPIYAPATLVIKAIMALLFCWIAGKNARLWPCVFGAVVASLWMLFGYYLFNATVLGYGWQTAFVNFLLDGIQPLSCSILGILCIQTSRRIPFLMKHRIV